MYKVSNSGNLFVNHYGSSNSSPGFTFRTIMFEDDCLWLLQTQNICRRITELDLTLSESKNSQFSWKSVLVCTAVHMSPSQRYTYSKHSSAYWLPDCVCLYSSPLNEDVFTRPRALEESTLTPDIAQLSEQIHRLLVQPVHSSSSQGYGSLASNGSHELQPSATSSSESNGTALEDPAQLHKPVSTHIHTRSVTQGQSLSV